MPIVVTLAVSVLKLLIPPNTALKSYYRSNGGEKREGTGDSNNVLALSGGLFTEGFRKYSSSGNVLNAIKGATRLAYLFLVVGITILVVGIAILVVGIAILVVGSTYYIILSPRSYYTYK